MTTDHELERSGKGWRLSARWEAGTLQRTAGPSEVTITLTDDADPAARQRGITTGVMRQVERALREVTDEYAATVHKRLTTYTIMTTRWTQEQMNKLPPGPREGGDAYYSGLLSVFDEMVKMGHPAPLNLLADVTGVPKETLRSRVKIARARRSKEAHA